MVDNCICDLMHFGAACAMKHVRYIPQYNEAEFNRMAKRVDKVLIARRIKAQLKETGEKKK